MANHNQYQRYLHGVIQTALSDTPVVFLMGARQTGKTTLVKSLVNGTWQLFNLDDATQRNLIASDPSGFINHLDARHVVIDEIQRIPELLLSIKQSIDNHRQPGRFLLTGSANALVLPNVLDSLAGRIECIELQPLSECEMRGTKPTFLHYLLAGQPPKVKQHIDRATWIERITVGSFPEPVLRQTSKRKSAWYQQYLNALVKKDMRDLTAIEHPDKMLSLLKLTAHYSGKLVNFNELGSKVKLDKDTVRKYLFLIEQLFLLKPLSAWHTNISKRLIKTPKLHLVDTGLISSIRGIDASHLRSHPDELGSLLETFVINELQKQANFQNDETLNFYHYRDKDKVEVDCIIENAKGDCFAIEVKASATLTPTAFRGLRKFQSIAKERFQIGILLYDGEQVLPCGDKLWAIPIGALWGS